MNPRRCGDTAAQDLLGMYVLGRLDPLAQEAARGHLGGCPVCRELAGSLRTVALALDLLAPADRAEFAVLGDGESAPDSRREVVDQNLVLSAVSVGPARCRFGPAAAVRTGRRGRPALSASGRGEASGPPTGPAGGN